VQHLAYAKLRPDCGCVPRQGDRRDHLRRRQRPLRAQGVGGATGATEAGITLLGDPDAVLTKALGMEFTAPPIGLYNRSNRYAVVLDDGVVTHANIDEPNTCDISRGEQLLETL
jgi:glutaredoxin/glutathione-dependent peroxiredoxin